MTTEAELVSPAKVFARSTDESAWLGPKQESALAHLNGQASVKILLGPPSSGKSMILRQFEKHAKDAVVLPISGPQRSALGVLSGLLSAAGLEMSTLSEIEQRNLLAVFAEHRGFQGKRLVICIDRISEFSCEAWEEIERLTLLQFADRPLVELVIAATERDGSRAPLNGLLQRSSTCPIEAVHFLSAPDGQDLDGYIGWRLARFGIHNNFTAEACEAIASLSGGRFNSVNLICQVLLWNRSSSNARLIDAEAVRGALSKLAGLKDSHSPSNTQKLECLKLDDTPAEAELDGRLIVTTEAGQICEISLKECVIIGRSKGCDVRLNSRLVSRHHAAIMPTGENSYFIADLDSRNGVLVNGKFVKRSVLNDGDIIDISDFRIQVELNEKIHFAEKVEIVNYADDGDTDIMPAPDIDLQRVRLAGEQ